MSAPGTHDRPPVPPRRTTTLAPAQSALLRTVLILTAILVATGAFLSSVRLVDLFPGLATPRGTLPVFLQVMILAHLGVGWLVILPAFAFALWHLRRVWRGRSLRSAGSGIAVLAATAVLAFTGPFLQTQASSRDHRAMFWAHVGAALLIPLAYAAHRWFSVYPPAGSVYRRTALGLALVLAAAIGIHIAPRARPETPRVSVPAAVPHRADPAGGLVDPFLPFIPVADVPRDRVFFPAAATTSTLGLLPAEILTGGDLPRPEILRKDMAEKGFLVDGTVGAESCDRCHPDIVEQWKSSAHRFSSFNNPFYRKTIEVLREEEGFTKSKWCSSCHDPAVMLPGGMDRPIDPATPEAQAGLTCLACHRIDRIHNPTGNGAYNIPDDEPEPYILSGAEGDLGRTVHDAILKARPDVHKERLLKPFFRTGEYCSACHKVSLDVPVNDYRWFRGQNEYDNWHDSGANHAAARTFYLPPARMLCQDCHMPLEKAPLGDVSAKGGVVRSHRFVAANTALPAVRGDGDMLRRTEDFLRADKVTVDIFAAARWPKGSLPEAGPTAGDVSARTVMALDRSPLALEPGDILEVHVVVRNRGVGHTFPGGTVDSNEAWIDFRAVDAGGREIRRSGALGPDGFLDPEAHRYQTFIVDKDSRAVHTRIPTSFRAPVYGRTIPPSSSDVVRFRFAVPDDARGPLRIAAELKWRKFDRAYTSFVYPDKDPGLPITTMSSSERTLPVGAAGAAPAMPSGPLPADWERTNDYGIALLLQGDSRGAARAFGEVLRIAPERIDGPRNLARTALVEGRLEEAKERLLACEAIDPGDPRTAFFWGAYLERIGDYTGAVKAYDRVLERFPLDRSARLQKGRALYLDGKYREALAALLEVLEIDPEHREAHYHRLLCYRALGDREAAAEAEKAYVKYQIDESGQEFTREYRERNPVANRESQRIHVHE